MGKFNKIDNFYDKNYNKWLDIKSVKKYNIYDNYYFKKTINISDILDNYILDEILDMLDDKDIQLYLRKKKLKKIQNNF